MPGPEGATMRAARLHGIRDLRVETVPAPDSGSRGVLLSVRAVGICGSDLHHYLEGAIGSTVSPEPFVLGHEFAAEVVEGGDLPAGTMVAVDPAHPCRSCEWCEAGHLNLCPNVEFAGVPPRPGAFAELIAAHPEDLIEVPADFDAVDAAMLEPLGVAIHALDMARLKPMDSVAVLGAGAIGLLILQVARASGAGRVVVVEPVGYRREVALELGADAAFATPEEAIAWSDGRGVDVAIEATDAPIGPQHAAEVVRIGGKLVLVGIPEGDRFGFEASLVRRKGLTIKMSRRMGLVYPRAIHMVATGRVDVRRLVTHRFTLEEAEEAFDLQANRRDGVIKAVVLPNGA